jgi:hypothetical protein
MKAPEAEAPTTRIALRLDDSHPVKFSYAHRARNACRHEPTSTTLAIQL